LGGFSSSCAHALPVSNIGKPSANKNKTRFMECSPHLLIPAAIEILRSRRRKMFCLNEFNSATAPQFREIPPTLKFRLLSHRSAYSCRMWLPPATFANKHPP
jgi:hypothetical protein